MLKSPVAELAELGKLNSSAADMANADNAGKVVQAPAPKRVGKKIQQEVAQVDKTDTVVPETVPVVAETPTGNGGNGSKVKARKATTPKVGSPVTDTMTLADAKALIAQAKADKRDSLRVMAAPFTADLRQVKGANAKALKELAKLWQKHVGVCGYRAMGTVLLDIAKS